MANKAMRIVLDLQGAQSKASRNRGIGRYSSSIAEALVRNSREHEIVIALNGLFSETIEPIRATFDGLLPQENIRVWYAPSSPGDHLAPEDRWRRCSAEFVREAFLASLKPDMVLVSSLFEGWDDNAITGIGTFTQNLPTAIILYDLIPLLNKRLYLSDPATEAWYENKLDHLRRANLLLAISESSRQEGVRYLGFSEDQITNISTAADSRFTHEEIHAEREKVVRDRYGLIRPFIMYTGGIDHRKNIEGLLRAYAGLPEALRSEHQVAVVCSISPHDKQRLESLAVKYGLERDKLVLTGFVPDDDLVTLYNLCKVFVFPSWHEGFGLPALEAMSCGAPTIGSNCSSIPEVIGRSDALFDPRSDTSISKKLAQVLADESYRAELAQHGLEQARKFSWDRSAVCAIGAMEEWRRTYEERPVAISTPARRPKLAYVSPLPPERSGISDYSSELLPELSRHYDIEVIVAQESVHDAWVKANVPIRSVDLFRERANRYERVLYHFGNSVFHQHMFDLLDEIPGVVVLHDFYLSGVLHYIEAQGARENKWAAELYRAHGYKAVQERLQAQDLAEVIWRYPCNLAVLRNAQGVIVHSENSRRMAESWYGVGCAIDWSVIPLLRAPAIGTDRGAARRALGLDDDDYIVCSFGGLAPTKLSHRLLEAWLASKLAADEHSVLIFVGQNDPGEYGRSMQKTIEASGLGKRIKITGWADTGTFRRYLCSADVGVQLRTLSRGETSAAVLDCLNYGLPTIVNANGSLAELPSDAVWKLPDEFTDSDLIDALQSLWRERSQRQCLSHRARAIVHTRHKPRSCADQYHEAIERYHRAAKTGKGHLVQAIAGLESASTDSDQLVVLANAIAESIPPQYTFRQLLVDVSGLVVGDVGAEIQRVVRSILRQWLNNPPDGYRVESVYAAAQSGYRYARRFTLGFAGCADDVLDDEPVEFRAGDRFVKLDLQPHFVSARRESYQYMRRHGIRVYSLVHYSGKLAGGGDNRHAEWQKVVTESDGVICLASTVAEDLSRWIDENGQTRHRPSGVSRLNLGGDFQELPDQGTVPYQDGSLTKIQKHMSFLMLETIGSQKSHMQALAAFEQLWARGSDVLLVIVDNDEGSKIRHHPELGDRLIWLQSISDECLERIYGASTCLLAVSEGEGIGLPLIEAAHHKLPIVAKDIPIFREVAGDHAYYFNAETADDLAQTIRTWLQLYRNDEHPKSNNSSCLTWQESAKQLMNIVLEEKEASDLTAKAPGSHEYQ